MAWNPFQNFGLKVAALALGTLLWLTVSGNQVERRLLVPVSYSNIPASLELTGAQYDNVSVRVRGNDGEVNTIPQGKVQVQVDLGDAHTGANLIPLRTDEVVAPPGVQVMQVEPGTVTVTLEKSGQTRVSVRPTVEGLPAPGYAVGAITVDPATVVVDGPESRLRNPISAITERVPIDGRTSTVVQDVNVGVDDSTLRLSEPRTVRVTVQIAPAPTARTP